MSDYIDTDVTILHGDAVERMRDMDAGSAHTCVTSPPYYGLRDYGTGDAQIGLEETPDEYVARLVEVFREVRRVLRDDGTLWLNIGDSYVGAGYSNNKNTGGAARADGGKPKHLVVPGCKPKDLLGIPWLLAFALRSDGWFLRADIIWHKPNPMPESVTDRPTKAHEYLFLLAKSSTYAYDAEAIAEQAKDWSKSGPGIGSAPTTRNRRSVWTVPTKPYAGAHFAVFPAALIEPCILAGSPEGGTVLDPFMGSGTTAHTARRLQRRSLGTELNAEYIALAVDRLRQGSLFG